MSLLFSAAAFLSTAFHLANVAGAQIHFESPKIIDTITVRDLDSNLQVAGDNQYHFHFINTGKDPLLVQYTPGSDPDFNCGYPREPIAHGKSGTITICAWKDRLSMDKYYTINDNSIEHRTIHVKRVFDYSDSTYLRLLRQKAR